MKQFMKMLIISTLFINSAALFYIHPARAFPSGPYDEDRTYARWVPVARQAAQSQYTEAEFVDFLYIGCKSKTPTITDYIYKFWMKRGSGAFGVYATVTVNHQNNTVQKTFTEKTSGVIPSYEKWRSYAVHAVQFRFPDATVMDYRPSGCGWLSPTVASQSFRFWIVQDNTQLLIRTTVTYEIKTEKPLSVDFKRIAMFR